MKKSIFIFVICLFLIVIFNLGLVYSAVGDTCQAEVSVLNQDPYPAVPGEKLEIVFVISNIDSTDCGNIEFEILDGFPFKVSESSDKVYLIQSGTFTKGYNTQKTIPVDFVVNEDAIDGNNPLEVRYKSSKGFLGNYISGKFNINVEDVRADFEVFVSEYDYSTNDIKFDVLNIGKSDIEAVTVEVLKQDGVDMIGSNIENIGDLSSNEDTSAEFKMVVKSENIKLKISYTDSIHVRRTVEKDVVFDSGLFEYTKDVKKTNYWYWVIGVVLVLIVLYFFRKRKKKQK